MLKLSECKKKPVEIISYYSFMLCKAFVIVLSKSSRDDDCSAVIQKFIA